MLFPKAAQFWCTCPDGKEAVFSACAGVFECLVQVMIDLPEMLPHTLLLAWVCEDQRFLTAARLKRKQGGQKEESISVCSSDMGLRNCLCCARKRRKIGDTQKVWVCLPTDLRRWFTGMDLLQERLAPLICLTPMCS